jgi:poly-gamma-glutamate biosynthesis protein PgsC/CapC
MIIELFIIGLVVGFLFYEFVGISPGGVVVPAYLAMFINRPERIFMTIALSLIVFLIIRYLSSHLVLYGRRKFLIAILLGFFLRLFFETQIQPMAILNFSIESIGYIIPGIIAHEMGKQKIVPTLLSLGIVTLIVFQISLIVS